MIFIRTHIYQTCLQEIPNGLQLVPDKGKNATFLPEHCYCHKSDCDLISPYNVVPKLLIIHKNKGTDHQLKWLLIVKQVLPPGP